MSEWIDLLDRNNIKPKPNLSATVPPEDTNDISEGYGTGSRWTDTNNSKDYVCVDNTINDAVWVETTGGGAGGPATDLATSGSDVEIDSTAPPGADYVLKSTSTTVATWQTAGGGGSDATPFGSWAFNATTSSGDPGAGVFRLNNATSSSATEMYIDDTDDAGVTIPLDTIWSTGDQLYINNGGEVLLVDITSVTDETGWYTVVFTVVDASADTTWTATNLFFITAAFASGGDVVGPAGAGTDKVALYDGTSGKLLKDTGAVSYNTGTFQIAHASANIAIRERPSAPSTFAASGFWWTQQAVPSAPRFTGDTDVTVSLGGVRETVTLGVSDTTFAIASESIEVTGDGGANTIATITGGLEGQFLALQFVDALVTVTDTAASTADTVNLSASFTSTANDILFLFFDGNKWFEVSRSVN